MHDFGGWFPGVMMLFWIVLVVALAVGIVSLLGGKGQREDAGERPEETLKRRLAAGEIDEEEYRRKRALLEEGTEDRGGRAVFPRKR